jgi:MFS family permease
LIRDIGGNKGISFGTGTLEMLTFFGNIAGPLVASVVADHYNFWILAVVLIFVSVISFVTTLLIHADESEPLKNNTDTINPLKFLVQSFKWANTYSGMNLIILGLGSFWMIDSMLQMNLFVHCPDVLKMSNTQMSIVMSIALIGIGIGSYSAGVISGGKVKLILTPIGGIGMAISLLSMYLINPSGVFLFSLCTFLIAMFSGIFMVPLSAYIQTKIEGRKQSDMIAYSNFTTFILMFIASGVFGAIANLWGTRFVFLFLLMIVVCITIVLLRCVPDIKQLFKRKLS